MNIGTPVITGTDKERVERLKFILSTPKGSVPLERDLGIDFDIVDMPIEVAKGKIIEAYVIAARKYINAEIIISFTVINETITPKVVIK